MKLIVESGATKTDWCFPGNGTVRHVHTAGMNFSHMGTDAIRKIVGEAASRIGPGVDEVYLYAAGLIGEPPVDFQEFFPGAKVECASDLLAAARAVCGHGEGIAAILGTGSNSCHFDGERIVRNVRGGGFIIGDEGGAAALGKQFVADFIKDLVPDGIARAFRERFDGDYAAIVRNVYREGTPAKYFGSIAPLLTENASDPYVNRLIVNNFRSFIERSLLQYDRLPVGVVGGFGFACRDILRSLGPQYGITWSKFIASPMEGLIDYYGL